MIALAIHLLIALAIHLTIALARWPHRGAAWVSTIFADASQKYQHTFYICKGHLIPLLTRLYLVGSSPSLQSSAEVSTRAGNVISLIARDVRDISLILIVRRRIVNIGLPASWGFKSPLAVISWDSSRVSTQAFLWISTRVSSDRKNMLDRVQRQQRKSTIGDESLIPVLETNR